MAKSRTSTKATKGAAASLLGSIGTKSATTAKSKSPVAQVTDQGQLRAMSAIIDAKKAQKAAYSALKVSEGGFRDDACSHYETRCQEDGTLHTSVKLVGRLDGEDDHLSLTYTQIRKCCKMLEDEANDPLRSVFGSEFDNLFAPDRTIAIDTGVLNDEQLEAVVTALTEALDDDTFAAAVTAEKLIVPKEGFFGKRVLDPKIHKLAARAEADGYAVPYTASFKL